MPYKAKIINAESAFRRLNDELYYIDPDKDPEKYKKIKEESLVVLDELRNLRRLQWDEDQRLHFEDYANDEDD
jgi:hypothetical protein